MGTVHGVADLEKVLYDDFVDRAASQPSGHLNYWQNIPFSLSGVDGC